MYGGGVGNKPASSSPETESPLTPRPAGKSGRVRTLAVLLSAALFCSSCIPLPYQIDTTRVNRFLAKATSKMPDDCLKFHENNMGIHYGLCGLKPITLLRIELMIARINIYSFDKVPILPHFVSTSIGLMNMRGLQFYAGIKYDPTEDDYLTSLALRLHKLTPPAPDNQGGS